MKIVHSIRQRENGTFVIEAIGQSEMGRIYIGTAKQNPEDEFIPEAGMALATERMKLKQLNVILKSKMNRHEVLERLTKRNFKDIERLSAKIEETEDTIADLERGYTEFVVDPEPAEVLADPDDDLITYDDLDALAET